MKKLAIIAISVMTAFTGVLPAQAFPVASAPKVETSQPKADVQQVQYWRHGDRRYGDRRWGGYRDRDSRHYSDRYYRNRHYRHHNGNAGAIIGGLAAGAIIGGALAQPRYAQPRYSPQQRYVGGNSHVNACYARYRSYRASDNTYQPNYGPRRQCVN
jgi:hypothetical protein